MACESHTHAMHTRPALLCQFLPNPSQLSADDPAPLEQQLQRVPWTRATCQDEVTLCIFLQADRLCLQDTHAFGLSHKLQVLHPTLDRVHLHEVQPRARENKQEDIKVPEQGQKDSTVGNVLAFRVPDPDSILNPIYAPLSILHVLT